MYWYSAPRNGSLPVASTCRWTRRASRHWRGWTNIASLRGIRWLAMCHLSGIARPALLDGPSREPRGGKHCREVFYVICYFSTHCAPDTPSAVTHGAGARDSQSPPPPVPRAPASNIAAARSLRLIPQASGRAEAASVQNTALSPHPCGLPRPAGNVSAMLRPITGSFSRTSG